MHYATKYRPAVVALVLTESCYRDGAQLLCEALPYTIGNRSLTLGIAQLHRSCWENFLNCKRLRISDLWAICFNLDLNIRACDHFVSSALPNSECVTVSGFYTGSFNRSYEFSFSQIHDWALRGTRDERCQTA